ncbi:MAG: NUDIX domain-containing protein [Clostridia bacterium]|nr:NUDIX domain-containing protein [Clostridia bacterium]
MKKRIVPFTESLTWPILAELSDENVLGTGGLSSASPRLTARAILKREDGLFAVMYAQKFNLYSLPGGGMEGDESPETAIAREIWEETGCICSAIEPLGVVLENRFHADYTQIDYYFVVTTNGEGGQLHLTPMKSKTVHILSGILWTRLFTSFVTVSMTPISASICKHGMWRHSRHISNADSVQI